MILLIKTLRCSIPDCACFRPPGGSSTYLRVDEYMKVCTC